MAHVTGTAFPTLLLAGSLAFVGRTLPSWLIPMGLLVGLLRGIAFYAGNATIPDLGVYLVETPLDLVAAWVLLRASRSVVGDGQAPAVGCDLGFA